MRASLPSPDAPASPRCRALALFVLLCFLTTSCQSFQHVSNDSILARVAPGDIVRITAGDGSRREFRVTSVGPDSIGGEHVTVPIEDVVYLERKRVDLTRTVGFGLLTTATAAVVLFAVAGTVGVVLLAAAA